MGALHHCTRLPSSALLPNARPPHPQAYAAALRGLRKVQEAVQAFQGALCCAVLCDAVLCAVATLRL